MAHHPVRQRATVGSGQPAAHQIEVDPPEAEAQPQRQHPGEDRLGITLGHRQAGHDPEHELAEDDDGEQPEALDQRVGGGQAQAGTGAPGGQRTQDADRRATRAIALSFFALAAYVGVESTRDLLARAEPEASFPGIVLAALSLVAMPLLARAKRKVAPVLGSQAAMSEANQTSLCAWLSAVLLVGLAALEGLRTWRAKSLADTCCD